MVLSTEGSGALRLESASPVQAYSRGETRDVVFIRHGESVSSLAASNSSGVYIWNVCGASTGAYLVIESTKLHPDHSCSRVFVLPCLCFCGAQNTSIFFQDTFSSKLMPISSGLTSECGEHGEGTRLRGRGASLDVRAARTIPLTRVNLSGLPLSSKGSTSPASD